MLDETIEAIFQNGVFRPLQPVHLPEHQRVTLVLPADDETFVETAVHKPLPLEKCQTIRVRFKRADDFGPLPYPVEVDDLEHE